MSAPVPRPDLPLLQPLGDSALLVRFGASLDPPANRAAIGFAHVMVKAALPGVVEVVPSLVSVLVRYSWSTISLTNLMGEIRLLLSAPNPERTATITHVAATIFDGEDIADLAVHLEISPEEFVRRHNETPLTVLATGFAPGFVYCGFHPEALTVPRRSTVRPKVPAGTVLFAAGQTAITSTPVPTGWHVIGHTSFRNLDLSQDPPTTLRAGDAIRFEVA
jgi:KipI family sensor histidine kinase inhibitor